MLKIGEEFKELIKEVIKEDEKILYNNTTGTTGNVTLSETSANFIYLEIFYQSNNYYSSAKIFNPNGKSVYLTINIVSTGANYWQEKIVAINNTSITPVVYNQTALGNGSGSLSGANNISIVRVVGYK